MPCNLHFWVCCVLASICWGGLKRAFVSESLCEALKNDKLWCDKCDPTAPHTSHMPLCLVVPAVQLTPVRSPIAPLWGNDCAKFCSPWQLPHIYLLLVNEACLESDIRILATVQWLHKACTVSSILNINTVGGAHVVLVSIHWIACSWHQFCISSKKRRRLTLSLAKSLFTLILYI